MDSDGKNFIYVLYGKLIIRNAGNGNENTVDETDPVVYQIPLPSGHIAYVTNKKGNLVLKDYDMEADKAKTIGKFYEKNFSGVKSMKYADKYYYVLTENNGNDAHQPDAIYKIKSQWDSKAYAKAGEIYSVYAMNDKDTTVYEDKLDNVYINKSIFYYNKIRKFTLLGIDSDDNIYLNLKDEQNKIIIVKDKKVTDTVTLDDSNYDKPYDDKGHIYLAYSNYFYDIVNKKKYEMPSDVKLLNISNGYAIYKNTEGKITIKSIQ